MSGASTLANSLINLPALREHSKKQLTEILLKHKGKKGLILDSTLIGPLGLVTEVSLLKEKGVDKIYHISPEPFETECTSLIYLVRPRAENTRVILNQIRSSTRIGDKKQYSVYFVPQSTMICQLQCEEEENLMIGGFSLDLIPFDDDILSMELSSSFREIYLDGDNTSLYYIAKSIMKLQTLYGVIPSIKAVGNSSKKISDMLMRMRREVGPDENAVASEIESIILVDRETDLVTPLCMQLTYEGLIDEYFGIFNSYVDLDPEIAKIVQDPKKPAPPPNKKIKTPMNSNDKLYSEVRDLNFSVLPSVLIRKAKELAEFENKRYEAQTGVQLRDFVKGLKTYQQDKQSLTTHTSIAERLVVITKEQNFHKRLEAEQNYLAGVDDETEFLEECINKKEPLTKVLRLLSLYSLTVGLNQKKYDFFRREIIQTYGTEHLKTLNNLEKAGLVKKQEGKLPFSLYRKPLNLIVEGISEANPNDIAYVYSGYAPLSIRLIQKCLTNDLEFLRQLSVPVSQVSQPLPRGSKSVTSVNLVFFVGGITFTEISALRWLNTQYQAQGKKPLLIATTKMINGDTFLKDTVLYDIPYPVGQDSFS